MAWDIRSTVEVKAEFVAGDTQPGFFENLAAQSLLFSFLSVCDSSGQGNSASVVALNDQKFSVAINDGDGGAQISEDWKAAVEEEAGAGHDPEDAALEDFKKRQAASLARDFRGEAGRKRLLQPPETQGASASRQDVEDDVAGERAAGRVHGDVSAGRSGWNRRLNVSVGNYAKAYRSSVQENGGRSGQPLSQDSAALSHSAGLPRQCHKWPEPAGEAENRTGS